MDQSQLNRLITRVLDAWNAQDVQRVLDCYTEDVRYRDPNTHGELQGHEALGRYLTKLFGAWQMTWAPRETFEMRGEEGVAFLWHATFRRPGKDQVIGVDGMDLALLRGERLARNEVYFDRVLLSPLMGSGV